MSGIPTGPRFGRQARAILWAHTRTLIHFYSRGSATSSLVLGIAGAAAWYGLVTAGAVGAAIVTASPRSLELVEAAAPKLLLFAFAYWQVVPIMLASTGIGLDLRRLRVYPVSNGELFALEVLLRLSTGIEMMLVLTGAAVGLLLNPRVSIWGPLAFLPWIAFNLCLSAGLRDLLGRLLARRGVREVAALGLVLLVALPQLLVVTGIPESVRITVERFAFEGWPWTLTARLALGHFGLGALLGLFAWAAGAFAFGWWQFQRGLRFDGDAARATPRDSGGARVRLTEWLGGFFRLPSLVLPEPFAAMVEKELRFLSRAPRFRLVFLMGFSFGLLIWLPLALSGAAGGLLASNYLTFVTVYALLLLGEVTFWNTFGFDRGAIQIYYLAPVRFWQVLVAKNIASLVFVLLEITAVATVCALLRMPLTLAGLVEAYVVTLVLTLSLLALGNLVSVHYPRPVNPAQSWRNASAGRIQAVLVLLYPVIGMPIGLAYLARFAFESDWAFYGVLAFGGMFGGALYWVSMDSAVAGADRRREQIVASLAEGEGPVTS